MVVRTQSGGLLPSPSAPLQHPSPHSRPTLCASQGGEWGGVALLNEKQQKEMGLGARGACLGASRGREKERCRQRRDVERDERPLLGKEDCLGSLGTMP